MIRCSDLLDRLAEFLAGDLLPDERSPLEEHLRLCPACATSVDSYRAVSERARQLPDVRPPAGLLDRLREALKDK